MILIYDFDGTLTPYSLPQYKILTTCGYSSKDFLAKIHIWQEEKETDLYTAFFEVYQNILQENQLSVNTTNICYESRNVCFNPGVLDYFEYVLQSFPSTKHFILTSGFEIYVKNTPISKYCSNIYGTTLKDNGEIDRLVTDKSKVNLVQEICDQNNCLCKDIIYIGDGLTDQYAMEYVKRQGGTAILLCDRNCKEEIYQTLDSKNILSACFSPDFSLDSKLFSYIKSKLTS